MTPINYAIILDMEYRVKNDGYTETKELTVNGERVFYWEYTYACGFFFEEHNEKPHVERNEAFFSWADDIRHLYKGGIIEYAENELDLDLDEVGQLLWPIIFDGEEQELKNMLSTPLDIT